MANVQELSDVVKHFGVSFLAYVCNTDEAQIQAVTAGEDTLSGVKGQVLAEATAILRAIRFQAVYESVPAEFLISSVSHSKVNDKRHIFSIWREQSGGSLPELNSEDPVLSPLASLAADVYPILLLLPYLSKGEQSILHGPLMMSRPTFGHPSEQAFEEAVLNDPDLSRLFPIQGSNAIETTGFVVTSTGRGSTLQLASLASLFIQAAYVKTQMRGPLEEHSFYNNLNRIVEIIRKVARGETVKVPVFVGFNNISIGGTSTTKLPWGHLRPFDGTGAELIPGSVKPPVSSENSMWLGFVLETSYDYRLEVRETPSQEEDLLHFEWPKGMQESQARLDRHCQLTSLAFALAIERQPPVSCTRMWTSIFDPLSHGSNISWKPTPTAPVEPFHAGEEDLVRVYEWASILAAADDSRIQIAQHRLLSALSERADAIDGFIDAIIAWENLFGSRQGELAFRISTAIAKLLCDTLEERLVMQRRIKKQYDLRSSLLHGGNTIDPQQAVIEKDKATEVALACLRRLYRDFPHLIDDEDRARKLALSG